MASCLPVVERKDGVAIDWPRLYSILCLSTTDPDTRLPGLGAVIALIAAPSPAGAASEKSPVLARKEAYSGLGAAEGEEVNEIAHSRYHGTVPTPRPSAKCVTKRAGITFVFLTGGDRCGDRLFMEVGP
jgi:hypothetical protein